MFLRKSYANKTVGHKNIRRSFITVMLSAIMFFSAACGRNGDNTEVLTQGTVNGQDDGPVYVDTLREADFCLSIDADNQVHEISDLLYGIFFEDINFAADGGLYAELIKNRSFEFTQIASNNELHGWKTVGDGTVSVVTDDSEGCLNENNTNYALLVNNDSGSFFGIKNSGFLDGISIKKDAEYLYSFYIKNVDGADKKVRAVLRVNDEEVGIDEFSISGERDWVKYEGKIKAEQTANSNVSFSVEYMGESIALDMVSLFPKDTYKGRENGLRADLAKKLEELHPEFLRFPGGCVIEGYTISLGYDWKDSIGVGRDGEPLLFNGTYGDVAARKQGQNIWTNERSSNDANPSFMTYGLGFYEYFLLAEDIGAIGVPVLNAGLACMGQGTGAGPAVDSDKFQVFVNDALNLVEFCRGDENTKWGAVRIAMGHKEPFALKYIGIGNEQSGEVFNAHYEAFVDAFCEARKENPEMYGDIELIFSAGFDDGDSGHDGYMATYKEASDWLKANPDKELSTFAGAIDQHYYNSPDWFLSHNDYYDENNYSRDTENMLDYRFAGGIPAFVGEYAAQSNTLNAALAEASYMTGLERNGDIVVMAAYAPLFGNTVATHWAPDLIWFNNNTVTPSINYYIQKAFMLNKGDYLLKSEMPGTEMEPESLKGAVGVGTWNTSASFSELVVTDNVTGEILATDDFSVNDFADKWINVADGAWVMGNGILTQSNKATNTGIYGNTGSTAYFGDSSWTNYTMTLKAKKLSGSEGFLIPFAVRDQNNNYFWNIGGWNNTVSCLQEVSNGSKSGQLEGTVKNCMIKANTEYTIKIVVENTRVMCYLDDKLYVDYNVADNVSYECYQVVSTDDTGDIIIKLVNVMDESKTIDINIETVKEILPDADIYLVAGNSLSDDNILGKPEAVSMIEDIFGGVSEHFTYTAPKYSVTILRVHTK